MTDKTLYDASELERRITSLMHYSMLHGMTDGAHEGGQESEDAEV